MQLFSKHVVEDFPPLLGPDLTPATSAIRAKYDLIRATEDVGLNLIRFFNIPASETGGSGIQPSINMIASDALIHLAKVLIKVIGDDQVAFSLFLRSKKKSCKFTHRIFIWPAVFVSFFSNYQISVLFTDLFAVIVASPDLGSIVGLPRGGLFYFP